MNKKSKNNLTLLYICIAYLFSFAMRMIWVYHFKDIEALKWNGHLMINTNDGYFFASGVKNLFDHAYSNNMRIPGIEYGLVYFTYILAKVLPYSLDSIILYLPSIISSFIVVPIILIMKLYHKEFLGFLSALIASITWSFYNRTMTGYYDTDLFALVFPVFIIYFLIKSIKNKDILSLFVVMFLNSLYFYAYDASKPVIYAIGMGFILYCLLFFRKNKDFYYYIFLISISMLDVDWRIRLLLVLISIFISYKDLIKDKRFKIFLAICSIFIFLYFNHVFGIIWGKIYEYVQTGVSQSGNLKFFQVHQTIREAGKISFNLFAHRISGSVLSFFIGLLGYLLLVWKKKEFLLFLPLIGIGFFAYIGGLRFTVYAIPAMAMGAVYFFYFIVRFFTKDKKVINITLIFASLTLLYPNIVHINKYMIPSVFQKPEVKVLNKLKKISNPKDYTIAWWDYGYPIWYYSRTNTLIDGGKHNNDNFIVSKIFFSNSQKLSANLARISIEKYTEKKLGFDSVANIIFKDINISVDTYLNNLKKDIKLPKKTRDIYFYLPNRMLDILPTIDLFSNLNLNNGIAKSQPFFYKTDEFEQNTNFINLGHGIGIDKKNLTLLIGDKQIPIKRFVTVFYDTKKRLETKLDKVNSYGLNVVFMPNYHQFLVMDDRIYNSTYIQLFVFENYDKDLFEPVIMTPLVKVYKLKR